MTGQTAITIPQLKRLPQTTDNDTILGGGLPLPLRILLYLCMKQSRKGRYVLGVDIGGTHLSSAAVDLHNKCLCSQVETTPLDNGAEAQAILDIWHANIQASVKRVPDMEQLCGIGMAFPGPFDYERGISLMAGVNKYERIFGLDVRRTLSAMLALPIELRFVNDASAFALGECLGGAGKNADRVVALTLGTGVGSGFVVQNTLVTEGEGVPDNGWVYCLPFEEGIVDQAFSTRWFCKRWKELTGETVSGAKAVVDQCHAGNPTALQLFEEYGSRLASFAGPMLAQFGADTLVLGGNISQAIDLFLPALLRKNAEMGREFHVKRSALMEDAALMGAASLFL